MVVGSFIPPTLITLLHCRVLCVMKCTLFVQLIVVGVVSLSCSTMLCNVLNMFMTCAPVNV